MRRWITSLLTLLILSLALPAQAARLTVLVLDSSRTMGEQWEGATKWTRVADYAALLVKNLPLDDSVAAITFGSDACQPTLLSDIVPVSQSSAVTGRFATILPTGDRTLVGGIDAALTLVDEKGMDQNRILIFTSGDDQCREQVLDLVSKARNVSHPVELQMFGLDMSADLAFDLTEALGTMGGSFQTFEGADDFRATLDTTRRSSQAGLNVVVNAPRDEDDPEAIPAARLEVYQAGSRTPLWEQSVEGTAFVDLPAGGYDVSVRYGGETRWQRGIQVGGTQATTLQFDFSQGVGKVSLTLADPLGTPMAGQLTLIDADTELEVLTLDGDSQYMFDLPPGSYRAVITVGDTETTESFTVDEGNTTVLPVLIDTVLGQLLISLNNQDLVPVNGDVYLYNPDSGALLQTFTSTSSVRVSLAPGEYDVVVRAGGDEQHEVVAVAEGDETEVPFELEVALGSIFVELQDDHGQPVFGLLKLYDAKGNEVQYFELELYEDSEFSFSVPTGVYSISASADGIVRTVNGIAVKEDEETEVTVTFPQGTFGEGGQGF